MGCAGSKEPSSKRAAEAPPGQKPRAAPAAPAAQLLALNTAGNGRFAAVLASLRTLFQAQVAVVCLVGSSEGSPAALAALSRWALPAEGSAPAPVLVEDCLLDAGYREESVVAGPPHIRFFCSAPLLGPGGALYGALCVADGQPRANLPAEQLIVLASMAEVVVMELERDKVKEQKAAGCAASDRAMLLHALSSRSFTAAAKALDIVPRAISLEVSAASSPIGAFSPGSPAAFMQSFSGTASLLHSPGSSLLRCSGGSCAAEPPAVQPGSPRFGSNQPLNIQLGELLGKGGYGRVYRGTWHGSSVAVKIMDVWLDPSLPDNTAGRKVLLEAVLGRDATHHPNLLQTYDFAVRPVGEPGAEGPALHQLWIVTELCNRGSLYEAINKGRFLDRSRTSPCLLHVLLTAQEIAGAMSYLHDSGIVHRDLTSNNVLLNASGKDTRRFTVKVGDFGLSRFAANDISTTTLGTVSHMPPELLREGLVSTATDVYSFGVLLWEMYTGEHPFQGMQPGVVIQMVTDAASCPLCMPPSAPEKLMEIYKACVHFKPAQRPSFQGVLASLAVLIEEAGLNPLAAG